MRLINPRDCANCINNEVEAPPECYTCCKKLENNFKPKINECEYCLYYNIDSYNINRGYCDPCKGGTENNYKIISSFINFDKCMSCTNCYDSCIDKRFCFDCIYGIKDKYDPVDKDNKEGDNE